MAAPKTIEDGVPVVFEALAQVVEALGDLVTRCDGDEGVRADGSNIDTQRAHAALSAAYEILAIEIAKFGDPS